MTATKNPHHHDLSYAPGRTVLAIPRPLYGLGNPELDLLWALGYVAKELSRQNALSPAQLARITRYFADGYQPLEAPR